MALSGNFSTNKYSGDIGLKLSWTGTQSIVNNSTTIKWTLTSVGGSSGSWWYAAPITVTIGGKTVLSVTSRFKLYGGGAYKKTGTITVGHNENGTRSVTMSVKAAIYSSSVNCTGSKTFTLNTINRYALISSVDPFGDEDDPTVVYTNPAGVSMVTDLKLRMMWKDTESVDHATQYVDIPEADWAGGIIQFDIDDYRDDLRAACPNSISLSVKFDLQSTMNETEYHHYKDSSMMIYNASPIPKTVSFMEMDDDVFDITDDRTIIIQRQSTLRIKMIEAEPQKSATISSYNLNFNGEDFTPILEEDEPNFVYVDFVKPNLSGVYTATFSITDSRGFVSTTSIDIPILDWTEPTADVSLARENGFESNCELDVTPHYSSISGINSVKVYQKNRIINTPTWTQEVEVTQNPATVTLANTNEWEMIVRIADVFASTEYRVTVGKGIPLFFFDAHRNSVSFNEIPDADNQFKVGGQLKCQSMYVEDISSRYTIAKTSGNWKINDISAVRMGNLVHMRVEMSGNGSSVSAGSNGFVGTLSGGPLPVLSIKLIAFYNNCPIMMNIEPDGALAARVTATSVTVTSSGKLALTGTFITND